MRTQREGFTLVELLVVSVLTAIALAGVYQTLVVQEKSYEVAGLKIHDQETLRTGLGILESELREIGAIGGAAIGGTDIGFAGSDSVRFRAQRKTAFICKMSRGDRWAIVWTLGDDFVTGDSLFLFVDGDSLTAADDYWTVTTATNASATTDTDCTNYWNVPLQHIKLDDADLTDVRVGAPLKGFEWVTYGLYDFGPLGWGLGRNRGGDRPDFLVGGLAPPGQGLQIDYFNPAGSATTDPTQVARLRITLRTDPPGNTSIESTSMVTNLYLRNN